MEIVKEVATTPEESGFLTQELKTKEVVSPEKFENLNPEEKASVLKQYQEIVSVSARKSYLEKKVEEQVSQVKTMKENFLPDKDDSDFIDKLVLNWVMGLEGEGKTSLEIRDFFAKKCKDINFVRKFFTDPETGKDHTPMMERSPNFAGDFLRVIFSTVVGNREIDREIENYNKTIKEFNIEYQGILRTLSDNILLYCDTVENEISPDDPNYKKVMEEIYYIRGAYDLKPFKEVLIKYPSVIRHTLEDVRIGRRIKDISSRYHEKLAKAGCNISLIAYVSDDITKSFEYLNLPKGSYDEGYENLFVFSLIRYFSMEHWDAKVLKMHNATINSLHKMNTGQLGDELKQSMREAIIDYLKLFH